MNTSLDEVQIEELLSNQDRATYYPQTLLRIARELFDQVKKERQNNDELQSNYSSVRRKWDRAIQMHDAQIDKASELESQVTMLSAFIVSRLGYDEVENLKNLNVRGIVKDNVPEMGWVENAPTHEMNLENAENPFDEFDQFFESAQKISNFESDLRGLWNEACSGTIPFPISKLGVQNLFERNMSVGEAHKFISRYIDDQSSMSPHPELISEEFRSWQVDQETNMDSTDDLDTGQDEVEDEGIEQIKEVPWEEEFNVWIRKVHASWKKISETDVEYPNGIPLSKDDLKNIWGEGADPDDAVEYAIHEFVE